MSVNWTDDSRKDFTHCVECARRRKDCPGWERPTGGCAKGISIKEKEAK